MFDVYRWMTAAKEKVNQVTKLLFESILCGQKPTERNEMTGGWHMERVHLGLSFLFFFFHSYQQSLLPDNGGSNFPAAFSDTSSRTDKNCRAINQLFMLSCNR